MTGDCQKFVGIAVVSGRLKWREVVTSRYDRAIRIVKDRDCVK